MPEPVKPERLTTERFWVSARKAVATFLFASIGQLVGVAVFDADIAVWKLAVGNGIGALLNLVYRWAEKAKD
mgnify:CR=1 FL=1